MAENSAGSVAVDLVLNDRAFHNSVKNNVKSTESAFTSSFKKIGAVIATAFAVDKVVDFGKSAVKAASDAQAAWTGLNSIVQGTGNNFDVAKKFLTEFTKDGLVGIEDAATSYKNLLARGYDTTQIEKVMTALKDAAAFGRQSSYTLSGAVVSATEGLKNENSILVDNAGVTKNVAKMWEEYAASIGKTYNQLTQAEKIQAEVNGILQETKFQTGDAATYTNTFAGRVQVLKGAFSSMQTAIGKVVAPIVGLFIPAITNAINAVTAFFTRLQGVLSLFGLEFPDVVSKTTTAIGGMGESAADAASNIAGTGTAAKKAAKEVNRAFASVDEINVINTKKPDASSGGGSGAGGVSGGGTAVNTGNDAVSSAIGSTAEKIMKYIKPLQDISFDNLINSFNKLKDALAPIGKTLFAGLEWAYFNLLVPLAKWTIEDFLPSFLNLLSGALKVLNPILQAFMSAGKWLLETFLFPIAKWTGGVVVSTLNAMGTALSYLGDAISGSKTAMAVLEGIAKGVLLVASAYGVFKASLAIGAVIGTAIASIKAWFAVITTTTTAMAAMPVAAGMISTSLTGLQLVTAALTGQMTLGAVASALWTKAQLALNAVMIANPIGLVVVAIAALIAGIVALVSWTNKEKKEQEEATKAAQEFRAEVENSSNSLLENLEQLEKNGEGNTKLAQAYRDGASAIKEQGNKIADIIESYRLNEEAIEVLKTKQEEYVQAVNDRIAAVKELEGIERGYADTQLAVMDAEDRVAEKKKALNEAIAKYGEGSREATRASLELESAENKLSDATGKLEADKEKLSNKTDILKNAELEEIKAQAGLQTELAKTSGDYDDVNATIEKLTKDGSANSIALRDQIIKDCTTNKTKWNETTGKMETDNRTIWTKMKDTVSTKAGEIATSISTKFADAKKTAMEKFEEIKTGISNKITAAKDKVKEMIDKIKGFFKFEWELPKIKTPHISWTTTPASGWIAKTLDALGLPTSIPKMSVNWYAQGGWLKKNNPQLAVVGDNKQEAEIIAPESKIREQVKQAIQELGGNVGVGQNMKFDFTIRMIGDDGRTIIKKINDVTVQDGQVSLII